MLLWDAFIRFGYKYNRRKMDLFERRKQQDDNGEKRRSLRMLIFQHFQDLLDSAGDRDRILDRHKNTVRKDILRLPLPVYPFSTPFDLIFNKKPAIVSVDSFVDDFSFTIHQICPIINV